MGRNLAGNRVTGSKMAGSFSRKRNTAGWFAVGRNLSGNRIASSEMTCSLSGRGTAMRFGSGRDPSAGGDADESKDDDAA